MILFVSGFDKKGLEELFFGRQELLVLTGILLINFKVSEVKGPFKNLFRVFSKNVTFLP